MTEKTEEPSLYTSRHEIVGHDIINRWVANDTQYTRVQFVDGTVEEFEIPVQVAIEGSMLTVNLEEGAA